ncbi:MAG: hypothetical protein MUF42_16745, partial [Cytophagaceae bacterium]|nr:hypothetical protein [Cytophagaceae bacterium]
FFKAPLFVNTQTRVLLFYSLFTDPELISSQHGYKPLKHYFLISLFINDRCADCTGKHYQVLAPENLF